MSYPNIPDVSPAIDISQEDSLNLLLASIAFEELALAHIINAEAEKIQCVLGTLHDNEPQGSPPGVSEEADQARWIRVCPTVEELLDINRSVERTLRNVIKNQMLPQFKLEDVLSATMTTCSTTTCTTTSSESSSSSSTSAPVEAGSAWTQGTHFGTSAIAKYTTLPEEEDMKTVDLVLGNDEIVVGDVEIVRDGDTLFVTLSTDEPYIMSEAHLYVDDTPPTNSAPGQLGHTFDPGFFFTTHTFEVDISGLSGTLYIAAHAVVFVFE